MTDDVVAAPGTALGAAPGAAVQTFRGPVAAGELGMTLIHEHVFVTSPELDANHPHPEWNPSAAEERAVAALTRLHHLGVRTVVDLTVLGLGRDVARLLPVAQRVPVHLVASTGFYTSNVLPPFFRTHGPGRLVGGPDPLIGMFVQDIENGIAGTSVKAGMLKVATDEEGFTEDVVRVMTAAAVAHQQTGVPITTHSRPSLRNGLEQQAFLQARGVPPERIIIGHSGDSEDLTYLRTLMDNGSTAGMDRFGMEHVLPDERRVATVLALLRLGYVRQMVLSHDAACFSRVTPPSWRAAHAPHWHFENLSARVVPMLLAGGATDEDIHHMMVLNPAALLMPSLPGTAGAPRGT